MSWLAIVSLVPLLGACWYSDTPLIVQAGSVQPVEPGPYRFKPRGEDPIAAELLAIPGGGYIYHSDDEATALFVHDIGNGWYAVAMPGDGTLLLYAAAQITGKRINFYDPPCDAALDDLPGVDLDGNDCVFTSAEGIFAAARLIAQRVERGEDVELNSWAEPAWEPAVPQ